VASDTERTTEPGPRQLYYGNWLVAEALGKGDVQVVPIVNTTSLAGYAVYSSKKRSKTLRSIVLVNMDIFNATTTPAAERPSATFKLPKHLASKKAKASMRRLSAPGAEAKESITFAGRTVNLDGDICGKVKREDVKDGVVVVAASEAVLVTLE
jgi:hypothetical protein